MSPALDPLKQWADSQPAALLMDADGCWELTGGPWGARDTHRWIADVHELGDIVADCIDSEWHKDELPARYDYLMQTGGILYDPESEVLYEDGGPAYLFI